jgi:hypothetical protein
MKRFLLVITLATTGLLPVASNAQYWRALPPVANDKGVSASFSADEKNVYFLGSDNGVKALFRAPVKGGPVTQVTKTSGNPIVRAYHFLNRPMIAFMRALTPGGTDYHIYRIGEDGFGELDLTPTPAGVSNEIIGLSYNGRYIYYNSNKSNQAKIDTYRYDTQQNSSEQVFPNDKDFRVLAWSRDHGKLLLEDPATHELSFFDIVTTDRVPLVKSVPSTGYTAALLTPQNNELVVLEGGEQKSMDVKTGTWKTLRNGGYSFVDYSPNGRFMIAESPAGVTLLEGTACTEVKLPEGARNISISPKETIAVYTTGEGSDLKIFVYDFAKKSSTQIYPAAN